MAIIYKKLFALLKERGYTTYRIRNEKLIGNATYDAIRKGKGGLDYRSINKICKNLCVQPGDIMEYVEDPVEEKEKTEA